MEQTLEQLIADYKSGNYKALLETVQQQEERLQFTEFTNDTAWHIGLKLVEAARTKSRGLTIDIQRNGQQLFHYALPGTTPDNDEWIKRKNRVVHRFGHSSFYQGVYYKSQNTTIDEKSFVPSTEFSAHGGAFPIIIKNVGIVGTITVSGLPQEEDHALVVSVIEQFLTQPAEG